MKWVTYIILSIGVLAAVLLSPSIWLIIHGLDRGNWTLEAFARFSGLLIIYAGVIVVVVIVAAKVWNSAWEGRRKE